MKFYTLLGLLAELDNFSLEALLEVKQKVDKLIQSKTSKTANTNPQVQTGYYTVAKHRVPNHFKVLIERSYSRETFGSEFAQDSDIVVSLVKQVNNQNDMQALDSMIALVDEWLQDESGYDEAVYPNIEAALIQD